MNGSLRVAALQLQAHDTADFAAVLDSILASVRRTAEQADLLVLPEATFPGYVLERREVDAGAIAAALDALREIARSTKTVVVVGAAASDKGEIRNAAFAIDADGSIAGRADKLFLWHFDRRWFAAGDRIEPILTAAGPLGVLVCADGRLPTIARTLVDRGARVLVMPTAWVTSGRNPDALENVQADLLARVRAFENRVPFVAANKCGSELGMVAYCGKSQIVDELGEPIAVAGEREAAAIFGEIAPPSGKACRAELASPQPAARLERTARIAVSCDPLPADIARRLELLDDACALAPGEVATSGAAPAVAFVSDDEMSDPAGLIPYRRAGYSLLAWATRRGDPWVERLARARALELRLYLAVFDRALGRAFAVDPDGTVVAGTFGGYRLASFPLDPRKTADTTVAPGSDVVEGLDRVAAIVDRAP
jgi:predicted amidohydrolase